MTVANSTMEWSLVCDGATENSTGVPVTSQVYDDDELEVILKTVADGTEATLTKTSDYTVTGVPGKTIAVITVSAYSSLYELYVRRTAVLTQPTDLVSGDSIPSETIEQILDKYVMTSQVVNNDVDRSLQVTKASGVTGLTVVPTASKIIGFNAAGTALMLYDTSTDSGDASLADLLSSSGFGTPIYPSTIEIKTSGLKITAGTGSPESLVTAEAGSIYLRVDGGADTSIYYKETGSGNTGWVARNVINSVTTDTIAEKTAAAGVTIDSFGIKDNAPNPTSWPSFSVHKNGSDQTNVGTGYEIITWSTEVFDTNSDFATNRFTPTVAGKYLLTASLQFGIVADGDALTVSIYKNGAAHKSRLIRAASGSGGITGVDVTAIADANGTSDYFEVFGANVTNGTDTVGGAADRTFFMGSRIA